MSFLFSPGRPGVCGIIQMPSTALVKRGGSLSFVGKIKLPTDPIGTTTVTFSGVLAGSEIHVYESNGTELTGIESCSANQQLTWSVYSSGSPNNIVFITIIKRGLRWQRFNYTSSLGNKSIPIFPQPDLGYNNPI